jgi:hypothetical protein
MRQTICFYRLIYTQFNNIVGIPDDTGLNSRVISINNKLEITHNPGPIQSNIPVFVFWGSEKPQKSLARTVSVPVKT